MLAMASMRDRVSVGAVVVQEVELDLTCAGAFEEVEIQKSGVIMTVTALLSRTGTPWEVWTASSRATEALGRGLARTFAEAGGPVVAVARTGPALAELATTSASIRTEVADAADATVAWSLLDRYEPEVLILMRAADVQAADDCRHRLGEPDVAVRSGGDARRARV
jgi:hypothetical protein